jgi:diaminobutyrate acetyltransferase
MQETDKQEFTLRSPTVDDGAAIWQLVRETGVLDENSAYAYLLLCRDFARTSLVAERDSQLAGFVTAYRPPQRLQMLFVWQISVSQSARRQGLGLHHRTLHRVGCSMLWQSSSECRSGRLKASPKRTSRLAGTRRSR